MNSHPVSPWLGASQKALGLGSDAVPLLLIGQVGSLPSECARTIHEMSGGGNFERVACTPDSGQLRTQVLGTALLYDDDFPLFDPEPPIGAVQRAVGGTLFLDNLDRCNQADIDWVRRLLRRQPVMVNGIETELDPGTRVIASTISEWVDTIDDSLPQWLTALFGEQIIVLQPLENADDVVNAIHWFSWQSVTGGQLEEPFWSDRAKDLLVGRSWPGGYEELRSVVGSLISASGSSNRIDLDLCQRILHNYDNLGIRPIDNYRRQKCAEYAQGLVYMGKPVRPKEIYEWIEQFSQVASDHRYDPWLVGLRLAQEISHRYYYSSDRLRILIRNAYRSLCNELQEIGVLPQLPSEPSEGYIPDLRALLVNPLGPVKSAASVLPHMSHLLQAGNKQQVLPLWKVAEQLSQNEDIQVVLFCDDFSGTGTQVSQRLVQALANNDRFKAVCLSRSRIGKPVVLGVVLGVAFGNAISNIRRSGPGWLPTIVHAGDLLDRCDQAFSENSRVFPESEFKQWAKTLVIDRVGRQLSPQSPGGFGNLQSLVVTSDNTPNDTLPAIWRSGSVLGLPWRALFDRAS